MQLYISWAASYIAWKPDVSTENQNLQRFLQNTEQSEGTESFKEAGK